MAEAAHALIVAIGAVTAAYVGRIHHRLNGSLTARLEAIERKLDI